MMQEFARVNDINLIAFHGNRKCVHQTADSDLWLTMFVWDEHGYFVKSSRPYVQTPLYTGAKSKVEMERDITSKNKEPDMWSGEIKPGEFFTLDVKLLSSLVFMINLYSVYFIPLQEKLISCMQLLLIQEAVYFIPLHETLITCLQLLLIH